MVGFCQAVSAQASFAPKEHISFIKEPKLYAKTLVPSKEFACLNKLWTQESHWNPKALNRSSGAYGIAQFMPQTWRNYNLKKTSNAMRQVEFGLHYIKIRYGNKTDRLGACNAWRHEKWYGWY